MPDRLVPNRYPGECRTCFQHIPAGAGVAVRDHQAGPWRVEHDGDCPPNPHNPAGAPTWQVGRGSGDGGEFYKSGDTLRERWTPGHNNNPTAEQVPGGRPDGRLVSGIVTVVAATSHYYPEDGLSFGVGADEGHLHLALVRAATDAEAGPVLDVEAAAERAVALHRLTNQLFAWRYPRDDAEYPEQVDRRVLDALPVVPTATWQPWQEYGTRQRLLLDEPNNCCWTTTENGLGGDDWSRSNAGDEIALRWPLTQQRRDLIADLRAKFGPSRWAHHRWNDPAVVAVFAAAGIDPDHLRRYPNVELRTAADANALLARTPQQWTDAGWSSLIRNCAVLPFGAADAARMADAGITGYQADELRTAGFTTAEQVLAAQAPQLPDTPGRFLFPEGTKGTRSPYDLVLTDDPAIADQIIDVRRVSWTSWQHHPGVTCLHDQGDWQLWSDGEITRGTFNPNWPVFATTGQRLDWPHPKTLTGAAATILTWVVNASNVKDINRDLRQRLTTATAHTETEVSKWDRGEGTGSWAGASLHRHDITLTDQTTITMWQAGAYAGGWGDGDADHQEWHRMYADESEARAQYDQDVTNARR